MSIQSDRMKRLPVAMPINQVADTTHRKDAAGTGSALLTVAEAAKHLRVSKSFLDKSRVSGGGPEFIRIGKRKILYRTSALDFWANARRYVSTSEYIGKSKLRS